MCIVTEEAARASGAPRKYYMHANVVCYKAKATNSKLLKTSRYLECQMQLIVMSIVLVLDVYSGLWSANIKLSIYT